jgi:SNF2 family DNA or RNA helicase
MEEILDEKMKKFQVLLDHGKLSFNQHQYDGVRFCIHRELTTVLGIKGGFIADEMGLGKTITTIATIYANYVGNTLIILPPVLLAQWAQEIKRTTGHSALIYHGQAKKKITQEILEKAPIVLATYNGVQKNNNNNAPSLLHQIQWARIVFDEAHHLRNKTLILEGVLQLKTNIKWLISGTPIQNSIHDYYNLCRVIGISKAVFMQEENRRVILSTLVLRRTKKEVGIEIPDMIRNHEIVKWKSANERAIAEEIHSVLQFSNVSAEKSNSLSNDFETSGPLITMLRAKQICILPSLMKEKIQRLEQTHIINPGYIKNLRKSTSKMDRVVETLLEKRDNGNGKIVFCHYRREIDELVTRLQANNVQNVETIDGRTKKLARQNILRPTNNNNNNNNININPTKTLILQIQTGCEGLNLQEEYSEIYFVTPHWNPSVEDQAVARCHRIGQQKEVQVFRFEMEGFNPEDPDPLDNLEQELEKRQLEIEEGEETQLPTISMDSYIIRVQNNKREILSKMFEK